MLEINFMKLKERLLIPNGYSIVPVNDMYLIVSTPNEYRNNTSKFVDIYIGQDSFSLMNMISDRKFKNILDLCAGSGIQGLNLLKKQNALLTSVEINKNAYNSIIINSFINCLEDKTNILMSDLYRDIENKQYDCILSNPPYVPSPKDMDVPICGDGGEDGFEIAEKIIEGYNTYLSQDGIAYMVLECIGNDERPYIIDVIKKHIDKGTVNIRIITSIPIEMQIDYCVNFLCYICEIGDKSDIYIKNSMIYLDNIKLRKCIR